MRFIKYRTKWSHGYGEWEFDVILDFKEIKEYGYKNTKEFIEKEEVLRSIHDEWDYSEHYRGIEYNILTLKQLSKKDKEKILEKYKLKAELHAKSTERCIEIVKELEE